MRPPYCPWEDLRDRYPHVHAAVADIAPARAASAPNQRIILIDQRLTRTEGRCTLAHEIAHLDLGHRHTDWPWFDQRQETEAGKRAARKLVPIRALVDAMVGSIDEDTVADTLNVDVDTLRVRMRWLGPHERSLVETRLARLEHAA